jgi:hypothetical protein
MVDSPISNFRQDLKLNVKLSNCYAGKIHPDIEKTKKYPNEI